MDISISDILLLGIPAYLALIISVALFVLDRIRYHTKLQVRVPQMHVVWNEGNQSLVLFRLIFVNHSLTGRTVVKTIIELPPGITEMPVQWLFGNSYDEVTAVLPNSERSIPFAASEILLGVLDIPPHQSQNKMVGYFVEVSLGGITALWGQDRKSLTIRFLVLDVNDKILAKVGILIPLQQLKSVGGYACLNTILKS